MKYLALLSGGKDSCYNLLHCAQNGHQLVAAASLRPEPGKEELDSYMYQTVGQDAIQLVADALDVPLYRGIISGQAIEQGSEYGDRTSSTRGVVGDETEDLFKLLSNVKENHPDIQGVSVGAILSNYQRVRVEHVCRRLSLTTLCYLWQRNQKELLSEMISTGLEAVLIKIAGIGLTVKHLGQTIKSMNDKLVELNDLYGAHICGEGGEYETLTLDSPMFKSKIVLKEVETVIHSDNAFATVAFLRVKKAILEPKSPSMINAPTPPLLSIELSSLSAEGAGEDELDPLTAPDAFVATTLPHSWRVLGGFCTVANVEAGGNGISFEEEVSRTLSILKEVLYDHGLTLSHSVFMSIFVSSMDLFARMNSVYASYFGISPPARACVAVDLPPGINIRLECIAFSHNIPPHRESLHVQGLSYWAPANIGPYSQAIKAKEHLFISGQIGLIPSSLELPSPRSLAVEAGLCFQHVERIVETFRPSSGETWQPCIQLAIYWVRAAAHLTSLKRAHRIRENLEPAASLFVVIKSLPKDSLVEKQVILHTGRYIHMDEDDVEETRHRGPVFTKGGSGSTEWQISVSSDSASCVLICANGIIPESFQSISALGSLPNQILSVRLFISPSFRLSVKEVIASLSGAQQIAATVVPCRRIDTLTKDNWEYAMCITTL